jgi:flagellar motor switch protein FliG
MAEFSEASGMAAERAAGAGGILTHRQKAAIIVQLLAAEGMRLPLARLPDPLQEALTYELGALGMVDQATLRAVAEEFAAALDSVGLPASGGLAAALALLDGQISPETAARLRRAAGMRHPADPWKRIADTEVTSLAEIVARESAEVGAVIVSKLEVPRAAELLGRLPGPKARRITYAVSMTAAVTPEAVDRIGRAICAELDRRAPRAFEDEPVERVGAILNQARAATRDEVLDGLEQTDAAFAERVRRAIFTFANIHNRVDPRDVPRVVRGIDPARLLLALAGARAGDEAETAEFILGNMSQRMATQLREDIAAAGSPKRADAEEAMAEIVNAIRGLEAAGEILLLSGED